MSFNTTEATEHVLLGETYAVKPLKMSGLGRLRSFVAKLPYPKDLSAILARIEADRAAGIYDEDEAKRLRHDAKIEYIQWPPDILQDPRAHLIFQYDDAGRVAFLREALIPSPGAEKAAEIAEQIGIDEFFAIYASALKIEAPKPGADPDQKKTDGGPIQAPSP